MKDIDGRELAIDETLDVGEWWKVVSEADQAFREEPSVVTNRELEKLRRATEKIVPEAKKLAADIHRLCDLGSLPPA